MKSNRRSKPTHIITDLVNETAAYAEECQKKAKLNKKELTDMMECISNEYNTKHSKLKEIADICNKEKV